MSWLVAPWGGEVAGVASARGTYPRRDGWLLALSDGRGALSFGEATPLPGFGDDDLDRARAELVPEELPAPVDDLDAVGALLERFRSPSARFAVETALRGRLRRRAPRGRVLRSVLIGGLADADFLERARGAAARGARTLKLKARGGELGEELRRLGEIRRALGPGVKLRLDLNGALDLSGAREALWAYAEANVELCEEPTSGDALLQLGREPTPWLADESAVTLAAFERFLEHPGCAGVVLKPTAIGGTRATLERARRLHQAGRHAVVTHAFEGPVALGAIAEVSLAVGGALAHGIDRHAALAAFPSLELPLLPEGAPLSVVGA